MVILYRGRLRDFEQGKADLQKQTAELEKLLNDSGIVVYKHDILGKITYINRAVTAQLGYASDALMGKSFQSVMCSKSGVSWDNYIQQVFQMIHQ